MSGWPLCSTLQVRHLLWHESLQHALGSPHACIKEHLVQDPLKNKLGTFSILQIMPAGKEESSLGAVPSVGEPHLSTHNIEGSAVLPAVKASKSPRQSHGYEAGAGPASRTTSLAQRLHSNVSAAASYSMASDSGQSSGAGLDKTPPATQARCYMTTSRIQALGSDLVLRKSSCMWASHRFKALYVPMTHNTSPVPET